LAAIGFHETMAIHVCRPCFVKANRWQKMDKAWKQNAETVY
jgi:hypothetical protein